MSSGPPILRITWPELLGVPAMQAVATILHDRPDVIVWVIPPTAVIDPPDFDVKRVIVFMDINTGLVCVIPGCG